ncbi:MAG: RHS repeat domain-containing protein, partial [Bacteroidales bacterium]
MTKKYVYNYGDFNGDGRTDLLVYPENYSETSKWEMYLAQQDGHTFSKACEGNLGPNFFGFYITDRDDDGDDDVMWKIRFKETQFNIWREQHMFYYFNGSTLSRGSNDKDFYLTFARSDLSAITRSGDFDGNGTTDYIFVLRSDSDEFQPEDYFQNVGLSLSGTPNFLQPEKTEIIDFNGNGKKDILALYIQGMKIFEYNSNTHVFDCIYSNESFPQGSANFLTGDFNGDGNTDFVGWYSGSYCLRYSTGTGLTTGSLPLLTGKRFVNDYNGDGKDDILCLFNNAAGYAEFDIYYGNGLSFTKEVSTLNTSLNTTYDESFGFGDFNGDGKKDIVFHPLGASSYTIKQFVFHEYEKIHLVHKITDGLNNTVSVLYDFLTSGSDLYSKSYSLSFPYKVFQNEMLVVKSVNQPDGIGGSLTTNYTYKGATMHLQGRGFLGFMETTSANPVVNVKITRKSRLNTTYALLEHFKTENGTNNGYLLGEQLYNYKYYDYGSKRYFVYPDTVTVHDYIANITNRQVTSYDANGNLLSKKTDYSGEGFMEENYSQYTLPGKPGKIVITAMRNGKTFTKETTLQYDAKGRLVSTMDFSNLAKKVKTEYTYDVFGNVKTNARSAPNYPSLEARSLTIDYDAKGRFPVKYTNALGHVMQYSYDPATGSVLVATDQNNLSTITLYDGLGRIVKTVAPTGIESIVQYGWYSGTIANAKYFVSIVQPGSPGKTQYFDALGRNVREETKSFDGTVVYNETVYNQKGQVWKKNIPFLNGYQYLTYSYDSLGRILSESGPGTSIAYSYNGKTVTVKNTGVTPNQTFTKTYNALGELYQATDAGGTITYTYHPTGQIVQVQAPGSTQKADYDEYGRQKYLFDPDADTVFYDYNAYGELIWQKDAKNNIITLSYDKLGRILTKTSSDGTVLYSYDSQTNGKGKAAVISSSNGSSYRYFYDNYSRLIKIDEVVPGHTEVLTTCFTFNDLNQQTEITYPSGYKVSNLYNNFGFLREVQAAASQQTIWKANTVNILGLPENYQSGSNITTVRTYDMYGNPTGIQTTRSGSTIQSLKYQIDPFTGNLTMRKDDRLGLTEVFEYDNLNRLTLDSIANRPGQHFTYNSYGNILTKTGTGTYTYDGSRPHAVSSIAGNDGSIPGTLCNITYNSTNKIASITENGNSMVFSYNISDMRNKVVSVVNGVSTTKYYSLGLYEEVVIGTNVRKLHYIYAGDGLAAIYVINGGSDTMYYIHKDHLGSFDALTNNRSSTVERMSFDAWGRRRNPTDWSYNNIPASFLFDRGYTGHEHMDVFGLINMNGRVYDPCLGRFLSPDIVVQNPASTQDYNRYSYVLNNPLKYTDPSGYTRPPAFDDYWKEYMYLMKPCLEMRLLAEENAEIFAEWFVKDVKGQWIRRENAVDVTGKGNYVNKKEVIRLEGKEAADFIWAVNLFNSLSSYISTLISVGITNHQIGFGFKNNVAFSLTIANGSAYLTWQTVIVGK